VKYVDLVLGSGSFHELFFLLSSHRELDRRKYN
jgi:hypothetical protein